MDQYEWGDGLHMDHLNEPSADDRSIAYHESHMLPCDKRYRTSKYFLEDQLRFSDAVADFRSVRELLSKATDFAISNPFQFQTEAIPIPVESDPN